MIAGRYERARGDLPWGWWLRAGERGLEDGEGGVWPDVRTAFWEGCLGMRSGHLAREQQELLLRVLSAIDAAPRPTESQADLFRGDHMFWRFYVGWLGSVGLTAPDEWTLGPGSLDAPLSEEGRAAMLMLRATRVPTWVDLPFPEVVEAVRRASRAAADDAREAALRAFERGITPLPHLFARERAGRAHLVTLTSIDPGDRMPVQRVTWSASFQDERPRDDLFGWIAERVHRWEDWGGIARSRGAHALTAHLLTLLVVGPIGAARPDDSAGSPEC